MNNLVLDIYHGNRGIDLAEWKARHALWAVISKCGGSEDTRLNRFEETTFHDQVAQARALGLHVGAYYYSDALTVEDALLDARHCVDLCLKGECLDMPVYLDIEEPAQLALPMNKLTAIVVAFCDYVRGAGYMPGIYSGYYGFHNMYEDQIKDYALWVAAWRYSWPLWAKDYGMWQQGSIRLSDGDIQYDDVPGYVDCNWCQVDYPTIINGGNMGKINPANVAALIHYDMVTDPRNGYSQNPRWGGDHPDGIKHLIIDGRDYEYPLGSYDCSSSIATAWRQAFRHTKYEGCLDNATCTSDFNKAFASTGLFRLNLENAKRGDLYNSPGDHVAMCQDGGNDGVYGYDCLSEFNRDENHQASGGQPGDQDGGESVFRAFYNRPWKIVIHYIGGLLDDVSADDNDPIGGNMPILFHREGGDKVYYWTGSPEEVPFHVSIPEKAAVEKLFGIKLRALDAETFDAIMGMCKLRKAWREQGIVDAIRG